jgi:putative IMPACT (imprinted ancient) family translation regulator
VAEIIEKTVDTRLRIDFSYVVMNDVMRIIKEEQPRIEEQTFDNLCSMTLSIRNSRAEQVIGRLRKVEGATLDIL